MDRAMLEGMDRGALVAHASRLGVDRPTVLTRAELVDEIVRRTVRDADERKRARGWLGLARDLLASLVERGLNLPQAAQAIRSAPDEPFAPPPRTPLATVTLAEIYEAQGHRERALATLDEVLASESDHAAARALRERILAEPPRPPAMPPEPEGDAAIASPEPPDDAPADAPPAAPVGPAADEAAPAAPEPRLVEPATDDTLAAVRLPSGALLLRWTVRPTTIADLRDGDILATLVVRVVTVVPTWDGPVVATRDEPVHEGRGERHVEGLAPETVVRAALGLASGDAFVPIVVALH